MSANDVATFLLTATALVVPNPVIVFRQTKFRVYGRQIVQPNGHAGGQARNQGRRGQIEVGFLTNLFHFGCEFIVELGCVLFDLGLHARQATVTNVQFFKGIQIGV